MKISVKKQENVKQIPNGFILDAKEVARDEAENWKNEGQKLPIELVLTLCEEIEEGEEDEYVSLPIDADGSDGGYLHVYGWHEA